MLLDRKSTRLNSSHLVISYAVFCLKKKKKQNTARRRRGSATLAGAGVADTSDIERERSYFFFFFFFNDTATTEIYTLSLYAALPICPIRDPIQQRFTQSGIWKHRGPFREGQVCGHDDRRPLGMDHGFRSEEHTS